MKSNDFLTEYNWGAPGFGNDNEYRSEKAWTKAEWAKIVKSIQRDCKSYLQQSKGELLYRGLGSARDEFMKKRVRLTDRTPKDMPQDIHDKLNKLFLMQHGAKFRNAMFCTGNEATADEYGNSYVIYPIGNFEFLWSPKVSDLYTEWENYEPSLWGEDDIGAKSLMKRALKNFHENTLKTGYTTDHLAQAIKSQNEIMMRCKSYYAIKNNEFQELPTEWTNMLK